MNLKRFRTFKSFDNQLKWTNLNDQLNCTNLNLNVLNRFLESFTFDDIIDTNQWGASDTRKNIFLNPITPFDWRFGQVHFGQNFLDHFLEIEKLNFLSFETGSKTLFDWDDFRVGLDYFITTKLY